MGSMEQMLYQNQKLQVLHLGIEHGHFPDAYLYAWYEDIFPLLQEGAEWHQPFDGQFKVDSSKIEWLLKRLDTGWMDAEEITFYGLEDELGIRGAHSEEGDWSRSDLIGACRYLYLSRLFDSGFWDTLIGSPQAPSEAHVVTENFRRESELLLA